MGIFFNRHSNLIMCRTLHAHIQLFQSDKVDYSDNFSYTARALYKSELVFEYN